jgi:hypothetical protein
MEEMTILIQKFERDAHASSNAIQLIHEEYLRGPNLKDGEEYGLDMKWYGNNEDIKPAEQLRSRT